MGKRTGEKYNMPRGRSAVQEHAEFICFQIDKPIKTRSRSWFGFQIHHLSCLSLRNIHRRDNITERSVSPKMIECQDLASYRLLCKPSGCVVLAER